MGDKPTFPCVCIVCFLSLMVGPFVRADLVSDAVDGVSLDQYETYQLDIESMGLGLYGGPQYNQGYRNRDAWTGGATLGNEETRLYLVDQFAALGLDVTLQGLYENVVGELPGVRTPEIVYIVCGHFDTTSNGERPGGDDNASGTAGVLEAARVLSQYRFNSTLRFIGFNAEEDWMKGSNDYVDNVLVPNRENVAGVVNLDMILRPAWDRVPDEPADLDISTGNTASCFAWVAAFMDASGVYAPSLVFDPASPQTAYGYAGDQGPFISAGYPAFMAIENTAPEVWSGLSNEYYHDAEDASDGLANDPTSPSGVTYDYGFATDVVRATVATLAEAAEPAYRFAPDFRPNQIVPATRAAGMEFFTLAGDSYLALANSGNDSTNEIDSMIYRWDGTGFADFQAIPTLGAADWEFFVIGDERYLAVANSRDDLTHNVDSIVYRWDGVRFIEYQAIPTRGAADWEFFTVGGEYYLAVANMHDDTTYATRSHIYKWDGTRFTEYQSVPTLGASDWECFTVGEEVYLAVANRQTDTAYDAYSIIYRWDGESFTEFQSLRTPGAAACESFTIDDDVYLAVANAYDGSTPDIDSTIYRWNGERFDGFQSVRTHGASDWEFFAAENDVYLAVANAEAGPDRDGESRVYRWNGTDFVEFVSLPVPGAVAWEFFTVAGNHYLAAASSTADPSGGAASAIYQYHRPGIADLDGDDDVDLRDYALFAAAWRAHKGQGEYKDACDISLPSDGLVDARDLRIFTENWLQGK
ncbi:MAG: M28 family peptidase [Sedimentisphaerales bacterium]|nr:M28 family peptidase [Sedimentisphaerales bacterium]